MPAADQEVYKKSLLFEIVNKKNRAVPVASFILNVPPESIDIEEPQRVRMTKTFGGVFVDDYGPDTLSITISGHTGGRNIVKTLIRNGLQDVNGRLAFYEFRESIMRYKDKKLMADYEDYEMLLYDLSTTGFEQKDKIHRLYNALSEGYIVLLKKFKMKRSKEKPLFYSYNIELEGIRSLGTYSGEAVTPTVLQNPQSLLLSIRKGIKSIKTFYSQIDAIKNKAVSVLDLVDSISIKMDAFFQKSVDILYYPLDLCKRLMGSFNVLFDSIESIEETTQIGRLEKEHLEMIEILKEVAYSIAACVVFGKTPQAAGNVAVKDITEPTKSKALLLRYSNLTESDAQVDEFFMPVDITDTENITAYGYILVIPDSTTTLESLASEYYGNPSLLTVIAAFNDFQGDEDIVIGVPIKVPVLVQGGSIFDNYVFSEIASDVYGADLRLDNYGNIVVSGSGDLASLEGPANIIQALNLRLNDALGSRLRLTVYGIRNTVGSAMSNLTPIAYIVTNIKDTVMQDPRVNNVYNMRIQGAGDTLNISFNIETIKVSETILFTGGVT